MTCDEAEILIHALIDNELDASHAREVEAHISTCPRYTAELAACRRLCEVMTMTELRYAESRRRSARTSLLETRRSSL